MGKMNELFDLELIAPCGMNCGICLSFFGYTISGLKRKHPCEGCRARDKLCAFIKKKCDLLSNKKVEYCFECKDFPCVNLKKLDKRYRTRFSMSMIENLEYMKKNGVKKFVEKERERWKCPKCNGVICVHDRRCYTCEVS
jgi:hypothetical protein